LIKILRISLYHALPAIFKLKRSQLHEKLRDLLSLGAAIVQSDRDSRLWYCVTKRMRFATIRVGAVSAAIIGAAAYLYCQTAATKAAPGSDSQGLPPRAGPTDYQAHGKAGPVTIAAEFSGHFVPTKEATYTTEDYVVVETGLFGEPEARLTLSPGDFSLRINGKKMASPAQSYVLVMSSLKDPEWSPPGSSSSPSKSKTSVNGGGGGQGDSAPPAPVHMPPELQHRMNVRVQKASLAEGDRPLPQAGLLFFSYRGQTKGIRSVELLYKGPAGEATIALHP
jgi:hypothetical protein